ncbi:MAG: HAD family hydrolase [Crocinitomicaceae bacterium]|nr:HAD family hydrolase [Crocinitomicaceae bacterium]
MSQENCFHCGDSIIGKAIHFEELDFCCTGCKNVYSLLSANNLGDYYKYEQNPGLKPTSLRSDKYNFLDIPEIRKRYIQFENEKMVRVTLSLPSIHCSSCIYLLENANKINQDIISSQVHFAKKEAVVAYNPSEIKFSELANFLDHIGYPPNFEQKKEKTEIIDKKFLLKIGIAGFAFGSIMLWSAPEYMGIEKDNIGFRNFTAYLAFIASLPVLLFSASDYFVSAYKALRSKHLNLDVPISIGIMALYLQSSYAIFSKQGPGYMDSFAGFIFFLLIGKWFQSMSYRSLSFDRDYTAYFPVATTRLKDEQEEILAIEKLEVDDVILVRNEEIIPCDSLLLSDSTSIDYSFVTGESEPITLTKGMEIFAGGKLIGNRVKLRVKATTNRSHLTQLWNETLNKHKENNLIRYQDKIAYYFLIIQFVIAGAASIFWFFVDPSLITKVLVSILIVACPCALALSAPFTLGNIMRVFGKTGFFLKNTTVVEALGNITDIVFDKTGTLTDPNHYSIEEKLVSISEEEKDVLFEMTKNSTHPLSIALHKQMDARKEAVIQDFKEIKGEGIEANYEENVYRLGNAKFCGIQETENSNSIVNFTKNGELLQQFEFTGKFRTELTSMLKELKGYDLHVLSGDTEKDRLKLVEIGFKNENLYFHQKPQDKYDFIEKLNESGKKVLMIGDGLNDTGAIGIAQVGIAISEDMFRFTPSSDAILDAKQLIKLPNYLKAVSYSKTVLRSCLSFSIFYNTIGLSFATSGTLTPFVAAILMPTSSISVVLLSTLMVQLKYRNFGK